MTSHPNESSRRHRPFRRFLSRWFLYNLMLSGILSLLWLIFRSGPKPSRLAYPCQRAAAGTAVAAFGAPLAAVFLAARRRVLLWMRTPALIAAGVLGLLLTASISIYLSRADQYNGPILDPARDYRAPIYHVTDCPEDPGEDHFVGLANLLCVMGQGGLKFYDSPDLSVVSGPGGIIATGDVVVIKINYQWPQRGGTNTDLLRGLIRAVVDHPDGFAGEVVVCENAQFNSTQGFNYAENNAQDHGLSPYDVVVHFQQLGYNVSHFDWTTIRGVQVTEYSQGNMTNGYIVGAYDGDYQGKLSYPKFQSAAGSYISLKHGVWDPDSQTYDRAVLKFLNVPVLKSHHATYGATVSTKHYMGVVTDQFQTNSHSAIRWGIMGALMNEIQLADLHIVDAIWINANPYDGPWTTYAGATRRDELVASLDPIAVDRWAVKNILIPGFISNGYSPPWPTPSADPDLPGSAFRTYLDNSMYQLLATGHQVTNDYAQMDLHEGSGTAGDFNHDGMVDLSDYDAFAACFTGPNGGPIGPECAQGDFDGDQDVDCGDWECFKTVWTSSESVPELPECSSTGAPEVEPPVTLPGAAPIGTGVLGSRPNPTTGGTTVEYALAGAGEVRLSVFDVRGRQVRTLVEGRAEAGRYAAYWDGRDAAGAQVPAGVYWCRLETAAEDGLSRATQIVIR